MGQNFDDYPGFQQTPGMPIHTFETQCTYIHTYFMPQVSAT